MLKEANKNPAIMNSGLKKGLVIGAVALSLFFIIPYLWREFCRWRYRRSFNKEYLHVIPPQRGNILDMDGAVLAFSDTVYDVHLDCSWIPDNDRWESQTRALSPGLARFLPERGAAQWWQYLQDGRAAGKRYLTIAKELSPSQMDSIRALPLFNDRRMGGGIIECRTVRRHPYGVLGRRTLGYVSADGKSSVGLEGAFDEHLTGLSGRKLITSRYYTRKGYQRTERLLQAPVRGCDVRSTLSLPLQSLADSVMRAATSGSDDIESACLVLMDVHTGAIRAMVNLSRLDSVAGGSLQEVYNEAIGHAYEPGSVLQTMTLASALSDGYIHSVDTALYTGHGAVGGHRMDPHILDYERTTGKKEIPVIEGLAHSYYYVFAKLGTLYADAPAYFADGFRSFCLPEEMDFDIMGFRHAEVPYLTRDDQDGLIALASGYGIVMTPLDILSFYNTIARGGTRVKPQLVASLDYGDGQRKTRYPVVMDEHLLSKSVADTLTRALRAVVTDGTAKRLSGARYPVAGKTGSSRQIITSPEGMVSEADPYRDSEGRTKTSATFVGFFPVDHPKYSIICVVHGKPSHKTFYGGSLPVDIVRGIVDGISAVDFDLNP